MKWNPFTLVTKQAMQEKKKKSMHIVPSHNTYPFKFFNRNINKFQVNDK